MLAFLFKILLIYCLIRFVWWLARIVFFVLKIRKNTHAYQKMAQEKRTAKDKVIEADYKILS